MLVTDSSQVRPMYSNLNRPTRFVRVALPAVAAAFFLQGNLQAQHIHFDTRYQTNGSSNRWQSPPPAVHAQPSPWNSAQQFPAGFHQLNSPVQTELPFNPPIGQPVQNHGMIQAPMMMGAEQPMQIPMQVASPMAQPMHEIPFEATAQAIPMESQIPTLPLESQIPTLPMETEIPSLPTETDIPNTETPLAPMVETEIGSPVPSEQGIPEGYDPAYPIEYPGADFQGFYPIDGEVIAPPSDTPLQGLPESIQGLPESTIGESSIATSDSQSSTEPQVPAIPSVVIEDANNAGIVMPETADAMNPPSQTTDNGSMTKSDTMSAEKMAMEKMEREVEAKMIKKLKQQMRAAELRAREAEEKAMAIARQSSSDQKEVDQLKAELNKSKKALNQMKSQATKAKQQLEKARKEAAAAKKNDEMAKQQLEKSRKEAAAKMKKEKAAAAKKAKQDKAMAESAIELEPAAEPNEMNGARKGSKKSAKAAASNKDTLKKKIAALETAREKQLAAAAERIKSDFKTKIDEKLESGKTDQHPEVLKLQNSLQKRLDQSNKNIRDRYKRQINKLRKEAAARSRS